MLVGISLLLAIVLFALAYTAYSTQHSRIEVGNEELELVGDFWARSIPIQSIRVEQAQILDLGGSSSFAPKRRTLGTALPGYASGWFRLRNGEKALVYLTRRTSVLYLPTSQGYSLLLSSDRPGELLALLQSRTMR